MGVRVLTQSENRDAHGIPDTVGLEIPGPILSIEVEGNDTVRAPNSVIEDNPGGIGLAIAAAAAIRTKRLTSHRGVTDHIIAFNGISQRHAKGMGDPLSK